MMGCSKIKKIAIYVPSKSVKGNIVLESIFSDRFYSKNNIVLIVDDVSSGVAVKYSDKAKVISYKSKNIDLHLDSLDYLISLGWGKIIKDEVLRKARVAAINCHSSLLPDYKGASVYKIYWAHNERYSGATIHFLTSEVDNGNIITQGKFTIGVLDTPKSILIKASEITGPLLKEAILKIECGYEGVPQKGGRYFKNNTSRMKLTLFRIYNIFADVIGISKWHLPDNQIKV